MWQWLKRMRRHNKIKIKIRDWLKANPDALHYLLERWAVFEPSYVRGGTDAERETCFREGRSSAGYDLLQISHITNKELELIRENEHLQQTQAQEDIIDDS